MFGLGGFGNNMMGMGRGVAPDIFATGQPQNPSMQQQSPQMGMGGWPQPNTNTMQSPIMGQGGSFLSNFLSKMRPPQPNMGMPNPMGQSQSSAIGMPSQPTMPGMNQSIDIFGGGQKMPGGWGNDAEFRTNQLGYGQPSKPYEGPGAGGRGIPTQTNTVGPSNGQNKFLGSKARSLSGGV